LGGLVVGRYMIACYLRVTYHDRDVCVVEWLAFPTTTFPCCLGGAFIRWIPRVWTTRSSFRAFTSTMAEGSRGLRLPSSSSFSCTCIHFYDIRCFTSLVMMIVSPFEFDNTSVLATEIQLKASRSQFRHDHLTCFGPPYKNPCAVLYTCVVCNSSRVGLVRELRYSTATIQQERPLYNYTSRDSQTPTSCLHPTPLSEGSLIRLLT
jgi:hypothetical protein